MFGWQRNADRVNANALRDTEPSAATTAPAVDIEVRQLSVTAQTIESFASVIGDIASQIDQLNATIESACISEGDFAVVAGEVRTLAAEVRLAADAIATAVAGSDGISSEVASALEGIRHAIHRINTLMADAVAASSSSGHSPRLVRYRN